MNIFDILGGLLFTKKPSPLTNVEEEKMFDSYMINRWVSMVDGDCAKLINQTTNKFGVHMEDKNLQYNFLKTVLPKYKFRKINYIKKKAVE